MCGREMTATCTAVGGDGEGRVGYMKGKLKDNKKRWKANKEMSNRGKEWNMKKKIVVAKDGRMGHECREWYKGWETDQELMGKEKEILFRAAAEYVVEGQQQHAQLWGEDGGKNICGNRYKGRLTKRK